MKNAFTILSMTLLPLTGCSGDTGLPVTAPTNDGSAGVFDLQAVDIARPVVVFDLHVVDLAGPVDQGCSAPWGWCPSSQGPVCTSLLTLTDCGACGRPCAPAHAIGTCAAGTCVAHCLPHWFDCNGDPQDGCEIDASSDLENCGHCGNICPAFPGQLPRCVNSLCCPHCEQPGLRDCNDDCQCDTVVLTDPNNCGSCGHVCPMGMVCSQAVCQ